MIETRSISATTELRMTADGRTMYGLAARYNVDSKPGLGYTERIAVGAFDRSLASDQDVVALYNHDHNQLLGRRSSGTLRLESVGEGLRFEVDLPESRDDIRELVARGDLNEMSFGFVIEADDWTTESGQRVRTLEHVSLRDISVVTEAQYPTTAVNIRNQNSMDTQALYSELRSLTNQAHAILDQETRNAEDQAVLERLTSRMDELESELKEGRSRDKLAEIESLLDAPVRKANRTTAAKSDSVYATDEYRSAFMHYVATRGDTTELRVMNLSDDSTVVPTDLDTTLVEKIDDLTPMRQYANVENWPSNRELPVENGIGSANWVGENTSSTPVDATFSSNISYRAYKACAAVAVTQELLEDAVVPNFEGYLTRLLSRRFAQLFNAAYTNGDGSSKPTGIYVDAGVASTTHTLGSGETAFSDITADDIIETHFKLGSQYRQAPGAAWYMGDDVYKQIRMMKDTTGRYLFRFAEEASDIRDGQPGTLMGYPVRILEGTPAEAASAKAILFGHASYFTIADRGGTRLIVDPYSSLDSDVVRFFAYRRTDSQLTLPEAFSVLKLAAS